MPQLGLNIDHVATLREARYRNWKRGLPPEPSVLEAASLAEQGGAQSITVHLREDRRHIQPTDVAGLSRVIHVPLNLEMAATAAMVRQALLFKPDEVCLVPENRQEVTTEGGLDAVADARGSRPSSPGWPRPKLRSASSSMPICHRSTPPVAPTPAPSNSTPATTPTPPPLPPAAGNWRATPAPPRMPTISACASTPTMAPLHQRPRVYRRRSASPHA